MGIARLVIALSAVPNLAASQPLLLECRGSAPDWSLQVSEQSARFAYLDRESVLDIPQQSNAEGRSWPKALTLIGPRDSAIVIVHNRMCANGTHDVQVLTQRGQTPVLLTGCCKAVSP